MARRWFVEFLWDRRPDIDAGATFFFDEAPFPAVPLFKEYARYLVRSRVGRINERLSLNSVQHYMGMIINIIEREARQEKAFSNTRAEIRNFVASDLVEQEGLSTTVRGAHGRRCPHSCQVTVQPALTRPVICEPSWKLPSTSHFS